MAQAQVMNETSTWSALCSESIQKYVREVKKASHVAPTIPQLKVLSHPVIKDVVNMGVEMRLPGGALLLVSFNQLLSILECRTVEVQSDKDSDHVIVLCESGLDVGAAPALSPTAVSMPTLEPELPLSTAPGDPPATTKKRRSPTLATGAPKEKKPKQPKPPKEPKEPKVKKVREAKPPTAPLSPEDEMLLQATRDIFGAI